MKKIINIIIKLNFIFMLSILYAVAYAENTTTTDSLPKTQQLQIVDYLPDSGLVAERNEARRELTYKFIDNRGIAILNSATLAKDLEKYRVIVQSPGDITYNTSAIQFPDKSYALELQAKDVIRFTSIAQLSIKNLTLKADGNVTVDKTSIILGNAATNVIPVKDGFIDLYYSPRVFPISDNLVVTMRANKESLAIHDLAELEKIDDQCTSQNYYLANTIDGKNAKMTPLYANCEEGKYFNGDFNGFNLAIKNLEINPAINDPRGEKGVGLFAEIQGGHIGNFTLAGIVVYNQNGKNNDTMTMYIGGLAGKIALYYNNDNGDLYKDVVLHDIKADGIYLRTTPFYLINAGGLVGRVTAQDSKHSVSANNLSLKNIQISLKNYGNRLWEHAVAGGVFGIYLGSNFCKPSEQQPECNQFLSKTTAESMISYRLEPKQVPDLNIAHRLYVGGLVGEVSTFATPIIEQSAGDMMFGFYGKYVTNPNPKDTYEVNTAGLVGLLHGSVDIKNSYNQGSMTFNTSTAFDNKYITANMGGFIGKQMGSGINAITLTNSYSAFSVRNDNPALNIIGGGYIGLIDNNYQQLNYRANSIFWDKDRTMLDRAVGKVIPAEPASYWDYPTVVIPIWYGQSTTTRMYEQQTYKGWDFDSIWYIWLGYPYLRSEHRYSE